uniref:G_PROTEIN_RECEP_F1_2 domain-containing protein n=2 Tax=Caenorhabditis tropicalis TaxID=1561998 RepID=A0A1I7SYQ5_9PELO
MQSSLALIRKIQRAANWKIILTYWVTPTLLSIVVLKDTDFHFNNLTDMTLIIDRSITQRNTLMALIVVSVTCIVSSSAYGALFLFLRRNSSRLSKSLRREVFLAFQVLVLLLAFFAMLVFYAVLNYFSRMQMNDYMYYLRGIYPLASGFLSYSNPYCILLLNRDLTGQVIQSVSCEGYKGSEAQISGVLSTSHKQNQVISNHMTTTTVTNGRRVAFEI